MKTILMLDAENIGWRHFEHWAEMNKAIVLSATVRRAYGDFESNLLAPWHTICQRYGITPVAARHFNKNQADMHLSADALEILYKDRPDHLILLTGDSDYLPMLAKFREHGVRITILAHDNHAAALRATADEFAVLAPGEVRPYVEPLVDAATIVENVLKKTSHPILVASLTQKCRNMQPQWRVLGLGRPLMKHLLAKKQFRVWLAPGKGPTAWMVEYRRESHG